MPPAAGPLHLLTHPPTSPARPPAPPARAEVQYGPTGWGDGSVQSNIGFNSCNMVLDMAPFGPVCPWLAVGGLVFTCAPPPRLPPPPPLRAPRQRCL